MNDTEYLDLLLTIKLPVVEDDGVAIGIRYEDVPAALRKSFDAFMNGQGTPVIDGKTCVWQHDWQRFLSREISRHHKKMRLTSLELGIEGPGPFDLIQAPWLSNWISIRDPDTDRPVLFGTPTGHPICVGPLTRTSQLCGLDPDLVWARTQSRWYNLRQMSSFEVLSAAYPEKLRGAAGFVLTVAEARALLTLDLEDAGLI